MLHKFTEKEKKELHYSKLTLEEYLNYDDGTDNRYELVNGELVLMPPESRLNERIVMWLLTQFLGLVSFDRLSLRTEIVVSGFRATTRIPDLMVLSEDQVAAMEGATRSTVTLDLPPPVLVVEVVSPGKENQERDYRYKRSEYAARGIAEYWIVDPVEQQVSVLELVKGLYEEKVYRGRDGIVSPTFSTLKLTAEQVLQAG